MSGSPRRWRMRLSRGGGLHGSDGRSGGKRGFGRRFIKSSPTARSTSTSRNRILNGRPFLSTPSTGQGRGRTSGPTGTELFLTVYCLEKLTVNRNGDLALALQTADKVEGLFRMGTLPVGDRVLKVSASRGGQGRGECGRRPHGQLERLERVRPGRRVSADGKTAHGGGTG